MKPDIHPETLELTITCSCGASFPVFSTIQGNTKVEICSSCHPFYTWEEKIIKTGTVDKFYAREKKREELLKQKKK